MASIDKVQPYEKAPVSAADPVDVMEGQIDLKDDQLDEAELFIRDNNHTWKQVDVLLEDESKMKALVRKVDCRVLPLLMVTYGLQLIDKTTLGYSAVFGLQTELNLVGNQYSWCSSIFYFGYLFWEYPGSYLAQHFKLGRYCSVVVIIWGAVLMLSAAAHDFKSLMLCRFFLGCLEAPITPCFLLIVSMWYDRRSQPFRAGCFYCFNGIATIFGNIIFYGIGQEKGMAVYRVIFILCGGITLLWGVFLAWKLPDGVLTAKGFTEEEKMMLVGIGRRNQTGVYNHHIKWRQIVEAFCDPQLWLCFIIMVLNETVNGGFASFGSLVLKSLVDSAVKSTALGIPQGVFTASFIISGTYLASRFRNCKCLMMALYLIPAIISSFLYLYLPRSNLVGLLFGYYIIGSYVATLVLVLQMPSNNLSGYTKRVTGSAFVFLGYCAGNIIGPQAFLSSEAPSYPTGCKVLIVCTTTQAGFIFALYCLLRYRNHKRDQAAASMPPDTGYADRALVDITDFEDPHFRYQY